MVTVLYRSRVPLRTRQHCLGQVGAAMGNVAKMAVACSPSDNSSWSPSSLSNQPEAFPWYALQIRQRGRELCEQMLRNAGYEYFSPCQRTERQWSDRKKIVDLPLFPGYVFCRFDPFKRLPILKMPAVIGVVSAGKRLLEVDSRELEAVRVAVESRLPVEPVPYLSPGEKIIITAGPLRGVEGVLERVKKQPRLLLSITMLNRSISVEVDMSQVMPLTKAG